MKKLKKNRLFIFIFVFLAIFSFVFSVVLFNGGEKVKAEASFYEDVKLISSKYYLDYVNAPNYNNNGITITNNKDGSFLVNGTSTAVVSYQINLTFPVDKGFSDGQNYNESRAIGNIFPFNNETKAPIYTGALSGMSLRIGSTITNPGRGSKEEGFSGNVGEFANANNWFLSMAVGDNVGSLANAVGYEKYIKIYIAQGKTYNNVLIIPFVAINLPPGQTSSSVLYPFNGAGRALFEYVASIVGPKANTDVYYASNKTNAGYYIYQKINSQFGVSILPAIRYTLTADNTILTAEPENILQYQSQNIDVLKLTGANGNTYSVYYDNITASNTKGSYFVDDNGTTTILQNADGSGKIIGSGLDALIIALQHALTNSATITTADHYTFNLCSLIYVFDTDFGYAKGVQEGRANYQPGQSGYQTIYNAGKQYGEQQKDIYYGNYYGGSDGVGGAGYTSIYNAGVEAGADISVNWVFKCMSAVGSFLSIEILPNITFGALIGIPFIITLAWFIIRQLRGGGGS